MMNCNIKRDISIFWEKYSQISGLEYEGMVGLEAWQVYAGSETHQGAPNLPDKVAQILERIAHAKNI